MTWGVAQVSVRYGDTVALEDVSLDVVPGTVSVVVGGDGAGKSTLLRVIEGLVTPRAGTVRRPPPHQLGVSAEVPGVWADLTVDEHLRFAADAYGLAPAVVDRRAHVLLARAGLDHARDRLGGALSGGMRHKLGVVLALLHDPALLILDEPTTGVDPVSRADVWRLIGRAAADGTAVLVATTYLDEAERAAEVLVLDEGRTLLRGAPADLAGDRDLEQVVIDHQRHDDPDRRSVPAPVRVDTASGPAVATDRVTRRFGSLVAVDDVSLTVGAGEVVGLVGANGAGKTTLVRVLLGLLAADAGTVTLAGGAPARDTRARVGYVTQGLGLWADLTLREHLALVQDTYGSAHADLDAGGLAAVADVAVGQLPLGLRRRAAFAVALSHQPAVLLLDEPTSGVDPLARARLWETIRAEADAGAAVLVSTHYLDEAARCDRIVLLHAGRVVARGTVAELTGQRRVLQVVAPRWQEVWERLDDAGFAVLPAGRELRVVGASRSEVEGALDGLDVQVDEVPATLDEVFLEVVSAP